MKKPKSGITGQRTYWTAGRTSRSESESEHVLFIRFFVEFTLFILPGEVRFTTVNSFTLNMISISSQEC